MIYSALLGGFLQICDLLSYDAETSNERSAALDFVGIYCECLRHVEALLPSVSVSIQRDCIITFSAREPESYSCSQQNHDHHNKTDPLRLSLRGNEEHFGAIP